MSGIRGGLWEALGGVGGGGGTLVRVGRSCSFVGGADRLFGVPGFPRESCGLALGAMRMGGGQTVVCGLRGIACCFSQLCAAMVFVVVHGVMQRMLMYFCGAVFTSAVL